MVTPIGVYNNGNGHSKPFSLPDPHSRVKPQRFRGWRPQIGTLENYVAKLAPNDPNRGELLEKVAQLEDCDRQARRHIAEFLALTVVDRPEYEPVRRKLASISAANN
jgi:hypothetical protein